MFLIKIGKYFPSGSSIFSVAVCLTLNQGTSKPRTTKFSATTDSGTDSQVSPSITTKANSGLAIYRYTKAGATCILLKTDAVVEVYYKLHTLDEKVSSFIPEKPLIEGDCNEDSSFMRISWTGYSLVIYFSKTPGGERWYISKLKLIVSPDLLEFHNTVKQDAC
ncbi:hypothetical protein NQ318_022058 [Aromia moschata]|uniref:Uncharacterized protein n=1 Tax=Aromia moschata TaxID=1265417 RepID=A0AAV8Z811_9CUCU|nr:hypothetical protein NQ318_022058 [Aromia moschata]